MRWIACTATALALALGQLVKFAFSREQGNWRFCAPQGTWWRRTPRTHQRPMFPSSLGRTRAGTWPPAPPAPLAEVVDHSGPVFECPSGMRTISWTTLGVVHGAFKPQVQQGWSSWPSRLESQTSLRAGTARQAISGPAICVAWRCGAKRWRPDQLGCARSGRCTWAVCDATNRWCSR